MLLGVCVLKVEASVYNDGVNPTKIHAIIVCMKWIVCGLSAACWEVFEPEVGDGLAQVEVCALAFADGVCAHRVGELIEYLAV